MGLSFGVHAWASSEEVAHGAPKSRNAVPTTSTVMFPDTSAPLGLSWITDTPRLACAGVSYGLTGSGGTSKTVSLYQSRPERSPAAKASEAIHGTVPHSATARVASMAAAHPGPAHKALLLELGG